METSIPSTAAETARTPRPMPVKKKKFALLRIGEEIPRNLYVAIAAASFIIPIIAWCVCSYRGLVSTLILPTPTAVILSMGRSFHDGTLLPDVWISVCRISLGFLASAVLAVPLGILIGAYKSVEASHEPFVGFIRYIPVPALIPLVMVAAGIGEPAKILLIFLGTYFQMVLVVADVTRQVPRDLINAARTLGARGPQLLFNVLLPATLPGLLDTCRTMIGWAWTYLVIAEVVATDSGIGYHIMKAQRFLRTDEIFVGIFILGILGLLTDLAFKLVQPRLLPWAEVNRN